MAKRYTKKKLFICLLAVLMLASLLPAVSASAYGSSGDDLKKVRVAIEDSSIFFKLSDDGDPVSGYAYEYIQSIAAYANWDVEYEFCGSFSDCLDKLKNCEVDLFYDVSYTDERAQWLCYPDVSMGTEDYYLFCLDNNKDLHSDDYETFNGKRVGVTAGTIEQEDLQKWCRENNVELNIIEYESDPEKEKALEAGEIDLEYEISMLPKSNCSALVKVSGAEYYLVANGQRPDLAQDINEAYEKLENVYGYFSEHLNEKYFSSSVLNRTLSSDELAWVAEHDTLKLGYMLDLMPFSDKGKTGEVSGIISDYVPLMLSSIGLEDELDVIYVGFEDNTEMIRALYDGTVDAVFPVISSIEFGAQNGVLISIDIISLSNDMEYIGSYSEKTTETVAVNRYNLIQDYFVRMYYPDSEIVYYDSAEACLRAVANGQTGSTITNGMRTAELLSDAKYDELNVMRLTQPTAFCFAVKRGNSALLSVINRAITGTDSGAAFNVAFDYINNSEENAIKTYFKTHKVLILTVASSLLLIILGITAVVAINLARSRQSLSAENAAKTSFLFNMSHDIRTPMNAIMGFTDIALDNLDNREKLEDCLNKTKKASDLLLSLINSILEMSKIEYGKAELNETPGDVMYSFENIVTTMQELARSKNIKLTFEFGDIQDRYVFSDYERCARVFINIITNAIKYTENGGFVEVKCEQTGRQDGYGIYRYSFKDNGIGISEEFQNHLFEEFSREENTTATGIQGFGLGLSVVKSFVELMNGKVEFTTKKGEGTTFIVTLPFKLQSSDETAQYTDPETGAVRFAVPDQKEGEKPDLSGKRVLLVEDNELNREIARYILEDEGMIVEEADDGTSAVATLKEKGSEYYDYVLMDIQMPIMNGYEAAKAIREMYPDSKLPIIAISANAFAEDKAASIAAGMDDHVDKPINIAVLIETLSKFGR